jgi:hypothetical protein
MLEFTTSDMDGCGPPIVSGMMSSLAPSLFPLFLDCGDSLSTITERECLIGDVADSNIDADVPTSLTNVLMDKLWASSSGVVAASVNEFEPSSSPPEMPLVSPT